MAIRAVQNAIILSFLEHLDFQDGKKKRSWAKDLLPPTLREIYCFLEEQDELRI